MIYERLRFNVVQQQLGDLFFLKPRWIGNGCIGTAWVVGTYSFLNMVHYLEYQDSITPFVGGVKMSFPSSFAFLLISICVGWLGWLIKHSQMMVGSEGKIFWMWLLPPDKLIQVLAAITSILAVIASIFIAFYRK